MENLEIDGHIRIASAIRAYGGSDEGFLFFKKNIEKYDPDFAEFLSNKNFWIVEYADILKRLFRSANTMENFISAFKIARDPI